MESLLANGADWVRLLETSFDGILVPDLQSLCCRNPSQRLGFRFMRKDDTCIVLDAVYAVVCNVHRAILFVLGVLRKSAAEAGPARPWSDWEACHLNIALLLHNERKGLDEILKEAERKAILSAMQATGSRCRKAAEHMGISRSRLYRRLRALGIETPERP